MKNKWIYFFGGGEAEGNLQLIDLLGSKGAHLADMSKSGVNVPQGFTITSSVCKYYINNGEFPDGFIDELNQNILRLENITSKKFNSKENPLLVSVRSGSKISMPGMMDTVLNLGISENIVKEISMDKSKAKFAYDTYKRFLEMYGKIILEIPDSSFELILKRNNFDEVNYNNDDEVISSLKKVTKEYNSLLKSKDELFDQSYRYQLEKSIIAVFNSWNSERAISYRKYNNISSDFYTAVNIQSMVYGNMSNDSLTGVVFTRSPSTGNKPIFGEFLVNAQGEDIVSGSSTPSLIISQDVDNNHLSKKNKTDSENNLSNYLEEDLRSKMPQVFKELCNFCEILEKRYKDIQDIEFTVEEGDLYILQTRSAKRSPKASVKVAVDLVEEGIINESEAVKRIDPDLLLRILHPRIDYDSRLKIITKGLPASPGAATGVIVFDSKKAEALSSSQKVILVRNETSPEDISGIYSACGILTATGGMTSHAAVVTRGIGKPCVCGASEININYSEKLFEVGGIIIKEGDEISIDGTNGNVIFGSVNLKAPEISDSFYTIMKWALELSGTKIMANAETINEINMALSYGAQGVGLCRTEHMFFEKSKIRIFRKLILSNDQDDKEQTLKELFNLQYKDFFSFYEILKNKPITIRLLDPPLHEFLPKDEKEITDLAKDLKKDLNEIKSSISKLSETNPMLGVRGGRLGILRPEIYKVQVKSILSAGISFYKKHKINPSIEIMLPLISIEEELINLKSIIVEAANEVFEDNGHILDYKLGAMIETPRAALIAGRIAHHVDFISFGTNDLTQTVFGLSRDDCSLLISLYKEKNILSIDPFEVLDKSGVLFLIEHAVKEARKAKNSIKIGICGEHAGNYISIGLLNSLRLDYVSCSPLRVPVAILAAANKNC